MGSDASFIDLTGYLQGIAVHAAVSGGGLPILPDVVKRHRIEPDVGYGQSVERGEKAKCEAKFLHLFLLIC